MHLEANVSVGIEGGKTLFVAHVWAPVHYQHQGPSPEKGAQALSGTPNVNASVQVAYQGTQPARRLLQYCQISTSQHRRKCRDTAAEEEHRVHVPRVRSNLDEPMPQERPGTRKLRGCIERSAKVTSGPQNFLTEERKHRQVKYLKCTCQHLLIRFDFGHDHLHTWWWLHTDTVEPQRRTDVDTLPNCMFTHKQDVKQVRVVFLRVTINVASHGHK